MSRQRGADACMELTVYSMTGPSFAVLGGLVLFASLILIETAKKGRAPLVGLSEGERIGGGSYCGGEMVFLLYECRWRVGLDWVGLHGGDGRRNGALAGWPGLEGLS
jgi:hypothetical protein